MALKKQKILIRVDGGRKLGMGHVVRCLAVADELRSRISAEILFVTKGCPECVSIIKKSRYEVATIPPKSSTKEETNRARSILMDFKPNLVVNDILDAPKGYMKKISELAKAVNFDDTGAGTPYADKVIFTTRKPKSHNLSSPNCILEPGYVILRRPFMELRQKKFKRKISGKVRNILVCMGGSDPSNLTVKVLRALNALGEKMNVTVVVGPAYSSISGIRGVASRSKHNVKIRNNLDAKEVLDLMLGSDIGIASCGISAWEMGATGLPMLTLCQSKLELEEVKIGEYNLAIHLGLGKKINEQKITLNAEKLIKDKNLREKLSKEGMRVINGDGLENTVDVLIGTLRNSRAMQNWK